MLLELYHNFLDQGLKQALILPRYQREVPSFFINIRNNIDISLGLSEVIDLVEIVNKRNINSDFFLFHLFTVLEDAPVELLSGFLERVSIYTDIQSTNLKSLNRIYGFLVLEEAIQNEVRNSRSNHQLYYNLLLLYNYGYSGMHYSMYSWDENRYRINSKKTKASIDIDNSVHLLMGKRAKLIIDLIITHTISDEIKERLMYLMPREEYVSENYKNKYTEAKEIISKNGI